MELAQVKAAVKAWEKAFKAENGRNPTKDDIKKDKGDIASQYALYRTLSKSASSKPASTSQSNGQSSKPLPSSASSSSHHSQQPRVTPRHTVVSDYPTTPTPPSRKSSGAYSALPRAAGAASTSALNVGLSGVKRKADGASSPPRMRPPASTARTLFFTPKKHAYSGPIIDPNPVNPFNTANSPSSAAKDKGREFNVSSGLALERRKDGGKGDMSSPFIHANSPKKLKQVLEANSMHRAPSHLGAGEGITPRTKARKRLRGEWVEDTPGKDRQVRRRRGQGFAPVSEPLASPSKSAKVDVGDDEMEEYEEDESALGPTPVKPPPPGGRAYAPLFEDVASPLKPAPKANAAANGKAAGKTGGKQQGIMGFFSRAKNAAEKSSKGKDKETLVETTPSPTPSNAPLPDPQDPMPDTTIADPPIPRKSRTPQRRKELALSDDEIDEWDPEGGKVRTNVVIVPTRREPKRPKHDELESILGDGLDEASQDEEEVYEDEDEKDDPNDLPFPLLSILSPRKHISGPSREELESLRVDAIFNPAALKRLQALKRGQDITFTGEGRGEDEEEGEDVLERLEHEEEDGADYADEDWESEDEGWKRAETGLDDEW
ncbi:hypothetical protein L202_05360 [Cryptococcus amylolentus CBS 6039]|uniref:DNA replication regulator SLD2 n=1 Tax=Cryptococcus amylolentus CBS 6039 TaxID=1295533 RepID=A0A1E3HKU4_9TREE|nr:hypothetical protein L202_05360 [Cryptococcus amylolentus CBS 6039]ODN76745.1 hypothetical protein L202_05360 [Cryptococcus amylolentus CBS 6039]